MPKGWGCETHLAPSIPPPLQPENEVAHGFTWIYISVREWTKLIGIFNRL